MNCQRCGSTQFEEENGLYYCTFCQTQSQGFTQEISDRYVERTFTKEVKEKRKMKQKIERKTGVLWTTTEAFNIILYKQMNQILEMDGIGIDEQSFKSLTSLIWFSYLRCSDIAFRDNETDDDCGPRLHPASRFRDQQIFKNKVNDVLPKYRNGSSKLGFNNCLRLGSDVVMRIAEESDSLNDLNYIKTDIETNCDLNDIYYDKYNDPRIYAKRKENQIQISKESRKLLREMLSKIELKTSFDNTIDLLTVCKEDNERDVYYGNIDGDSDELIINKSIEEKLSDSGDSKSDITLRECDDLDDWFENDDNYDDYDKELMRNLTDSKKLISQLIPLSYMKNSTNIATNYFIDLMSLPKTLAILNIVIRLLNYNIYAFDLIRWSSEGHIPYLNCLTCFPEDWEIISNDYHTFTSTCVPSTNTINVLTAKIVKHIQIKSLPRPDINALLKRFAKDLNLPKDIVKIIDNDYNLFEHFSHKLERKSCRQLNCLPFYERWALMAIVIVLKRIFVLDDTTERRLSESAKNVKNLFIWDEWEKYTRLRLELIKSYFIPLYGRNLEEIRDIDVITEHALKRTEYETEKTIFTKTKAQFKELDFRVDVQRDFQQYIANESEWPSTQLPSASLYPLTNATDFALTRIDSSIITSQLLVNFEDKCISPWVCSHGSNFHRGYRRLGIGNALRTNDIRNWSSSFKLLIELSSIILHCRYQDLFIIINEMEKVYFGNRKAKTVK